LLEVERDRLEELQGRFEHCKLVLESFEKELPKLQRENRELKTKVKDLKVKDRRPE